MLPARKNRLLNKLLYIVLFQQPARSAFSRIHLRQAADAPNQPVPVIACANHTSWWDAQMVSILNERVWKRDGFVMMEDTQLQRYQFFRYMGAFSVNRNDPREAVVSLRYATKVLTTGTNRMLLMFPQGEFRHPDERPLRFYAGIGHIARKSMPCAVYPIALRYELLGEQKPEAFISVGEPILVSSETRTADALAQQMQTALAREMDQLHADLIARDYSRFTVLLHGSWSINRLWDALRGKPQIKQTGPQ